MPKPQPLPEQWWYNLLTGNDPPLPGRQLRYLLRLLPSGPRCKFCNAPYHGVGGPLMKMLGKGPSRLTPQLCRQCQDFANQYLGGTEIELTMLFADVRGSTPLAEKMGPAKFSQLISRFFATASEVLIRHQAMVDKLVGDQDTGLFVPGFAGSQHRRRAINAAQELLRATEHDDPMVPGSLWGSVSTQALHLSDLLGHRALQLTLLFWEILQILLRDYHLRQLQERF